MKKYFVDCDGVVRNFTKSVGIEGQTTWTKLPKQVWDNIDNDPKKYLHDCEAHEDVVEFVKNAGMSNVIFLTNQDGKADREYWTKKFLEKHFGKIAVIFVSSFQEKVDIMKNSKRILIDDYPKFHEKEGFEEIKDRVYLMERSWNENVRDEFDHFYSELINN